jgi:hypothetical protein
VEAEVTTKAQTVALSRRSAAFQFSMPALHCYRFGSASMIALLVADSGRHWRQLRARSTYAVADALAVRSEKLVLLTPSTQIARKVNYCSAIGIHRRLYQADAELIIAPMVAEARLALGLPANATAHWPPACCSRERGRRLKT